MLPDREVVKKHIMLWAKAETAADQCHILAYIIAIDVSSAAARRKQAWKKTRNNVLNERKARSNKIRLTGRRVAEDF